MRRLFSAMFVIVLPLEVFAQEWAVRPSDGRFDQAAIEAAVSGRVLTFYDDGQSRFSPDGAYAYTYSALNGGSSQFGEWQAAEDGLICIAYRNGMRRCDMYVLAEDRLVVLTEDGGRYPVRPEG